MKYYLGIDTGTTSISIAALDESRTLLTSRTLNHESFIHSDNPADRIQNPERIKSLVLEIVNSITSEFGRPSAIGFTGQMHGILYVNAKGEAVSPLWTWQDSSGDDMLPVLREQGLRVSSGYGLATHLHLQKAGKIPSDAVRLSTISDYIAMTLCGKNQPILSSDMAAGWGCFDLQRREFFTEKLAAAGVDTSFLPEVVKGYAVIGETGEGVPVVCSMGDNQASIKGSVKAGKDEKNSLLVNVGTGSQVSFVTGDYVNVSGDVELRPYGEEYVLAGAALCGGRAYAMLEKFYREIAGRECYGVMSEHAEEFLKSGRSAWEVETTFMGTRADPAKRGSIHGISENNFTPGALTVGVIRGILGELHGMYDEMTRLTGRKAGVLVGSGNGMRKNPLMQRLAGEMFGMRVEIPDLTEEAACGCALCAMSA
ncbi:MAG: hypothetical protein IJS28_00855 [Synergistaceae bacterium]|nr:hypothetical protein [Synergistaceae bacterium]